MLCLNLSISANISNVSHLIRSVQFGVSFWFYMLNVDLSSLHVMFLVMHSTIKNPITVVVDLLKNYCYSFACLSQSTHYKLVKSFYLLTIICFCPVGILSLKLFQEIATEIVCTAYPIVKMYLLSPCGPHQNYARRTVSMAAVRISVVSVTAAGQVPTVTRWAVTDDVPITATATMEHVSANRVGMESTAL